MQSEKQRGRLAVGATPGALMALLLSATLLGGCASTLESNDELVQKRETLLNEEYVGNEIPVVDLKDLPDATLLVPPAAADVYTINPKVGVEGDYYIFNVHTRHGTYVVKSELALVPYCYDAGVLEMFQNCKHGKEIGLGMAEYLQEAGTGGVNLLLHPVDSLRGVGRSFDAKTQALRDDVVKKIDQQPDDRSRINRTALPGNALDSAEVLKIAYQLRVDAYTLNPYLQALLAKLAGDKEIGRIFLSGVTFLIPGSSVLSAGEDLSAWAIQGLNPGGGSQEVEKLISQVQPQELLVLIANFYQQHIGMDAKSGSAVMALLANNLYSPRQQAYTAYYLDEMKSAAGLPETVEYLNKTTSAFGAIYNTAQIELIHAVHKDYSPLKAIVPMSNQIGMLNANGQFIVIPLWDHTRARENVRNLLIETLRMSKRLGAKSPQIWFTSECDQNTIDTAGAAGIIVRRNAILDPTFRYTTLRRLSYKRKSGDPVIEDAGTVLPSQDVMQQRPSKYVIPSGHAPAAPVADTTPQEDTARPENTNASDTPSPIFGGSSSPTSTSPASSSAEPADWMRETAPRSEPAPTTYGSPDDIPGIDTTGGLGE